MLSIAKEVDVPEHHRAEQSHHHLHGGRASVRLYSRDDVWVALACQRLVVQNVVEVFRPLTAQGRGTKIPVIEPWVEIDPITIPIEVAPDGFDSTPIPQTTSKRQTLLLNSGEIEELTDSSVISSESSTLERTRPRSNKRREMSYT